VFPEARFCPVIEHQVEHLEESRRGEQLTTGCAEYFVTIAANERFYISGERRESTSEGNVQSVE